MTLKITISHASPGYNMDAIVKQSGGNPDTRITDGGSADFYVHPSNTLTVTEVPAVKGAGEASPQGGGGPGEVTPPV